MQTTEALVPHPLSINPIVYAAHMMEYFSQEERADARGVALSLGYRVETQPSANSVAGMVADESLGVILVDASLDPDAFRKAVGRGIWYIRTVGGRTEENATEISDSDAAVFSGVFLTSCVPRDA